MSASPLQIKRYPNRRYYARHLSKYVSLQEIEEMIQGGETVEIRDSQTQEDLTRSVLTQIIVERQPDKMALFPTDMLHFILRSNDAMTGFLRDYFRNSLTYLGYLQQHSPASSTLTEPTHWMKFWLDGLAPRPATEADASAAPPETPGADEADPDTRDSKPSDADDAAKLAEQLQQLEERLRRLESKS